MIKVIKNEPVTFSLSHIEIDTLKPVQGTDGNIYIKIPSNNTGFAWLVIKDGMLQFSSGPDIRKYRYIDYDLVFTVKN